MPQPIPTSEPAEFVAGDSLAWDIADGDYPPADGWALSYVLRSIAIVELGAAEITAVGSVYQVRVPPAKTAALPKGTYQFAGRVTNAQGEAHTRRTGSIVVRENLATAAECRTKAETELEAVEAAIAQLLAGTVKSYTIHGRAFQKLDLLELRKMRGILRSQVRRERHPDSFSRNYKVGFRAPGF